MPFKTTTTVFRTIPSSQHRMISRFDGEEDGGYQESPFEHSWEEEYQPGDLNESSATRDFLDYIMANCPLLKDYMVYDQTDEFFFWLWANRFEIKWKAYPNVAIEEFEKIYGPQHYEEDSE